jgi:metal-responsive CopG/Arc/MetJ family transcriptional regulator
MAVNPETTARKLVSLPHDLVKQIQDYRFDNRIASESEAIRRLIILGLEKPQK